MLFWCQQPGEAILGLQEQLQVLGGQSFFPAAALTWVGEGVFSHSALVDGGHGFHLLMV